MISCIQWIPQGVARQRPVRFELNEEEVKKIKLYEEMEGLELRENGKVISTNEITGIENSTEEDLPAELNMNNYDEEDDVSEEMDIANLESQITDSLQIVEQGNGALGVEFESDLDEEDEEDNEIKPTDSLLLVAITEDDFSHMEVQLYNSEEGSLFVHHDINLPDYPLCLAWLDCPPYLQENNQQQTIGNFVAIGTFHPAIEIWNLDVLDPLEPSATLGGQIKAAAGSGKKGKVWKESGSHTEAVMALSWNASYRQAMASGSADRTVRIWDVTTQQCSHTFFHHQDKVQSVVWNPKEGWLLATAAFDKTVCLLDCRSGSMTARHSLPSDVEAMAWDPFHPNQLYCSLEDGQVTIVDIRNSNAPMNSSSSLTKEDSSSMASMKGTSKKKKNQLKAATINGSSSDLSPSANVHTFRAHEATVSSLSFSSRLSGLLATGSVDKTVKVWDTQINHSIGESPLSTPRFVVYKNMNVGQLFSIHFSLNEGYLLACGGDQGVVAVWEADEMERIQKHFASRERSIESQDVYLKVQQPPTAVQKGSSEVQIEKEMVVEDGEANDMDDGVEEGMAEEEEGLKEEQKRKKKSPKSKKKN